jgi:hypothetical protein
MLSFVHFMLLFSYETPYEGGRGQAEKASDLNQATEGVGFKACSEQLTNY